jgi:hypothetical protein
MAVLTGYNVGICLIVAARSFTYGFGYGVFVTSIGQPGFYLYFNLDPTSDCKSPKSQGVQLGASAVWTKLTYWVTKILRKFWVLSMGSLALEGQLVPSLNALLPIGSDARKLWLLVPCVQLSEAH